MLRAYLLERYVKIKAHDGLDLMQKWAFDLEQKSFKGKNRTFIYPGIINEFQRIPHLQKHIFVTFLPSRGNGIWVICDLFVFCDDSLMG